MQNKLCHGSVWYGTEFSVQHMATENSSWCLWNDSTGTAPSIFHGMPHPGMWWEGTEGEQRDLVTAEGFSDSEEAPAGLSPHTNHGVWVEQPRGRWKPALPTPAMENLPKSHCDTSSNTPGKGFADQEFFSCQGCTQKPELKCSDSVWTMETEDYQWPESFVQGARICLIPGVTQSSVTELCLRPGWSTKFGGAGKKSRKDLSLSSLSLQQMQFLNLKQAGGKPIQCNRKA